MLSARSHRWLIGVLASAALVAGPGSAGAKDRDCSAPARSDNATSAHPCAGAATAADAAASAEEARVAAAVALRRAERADWQLLYKYPDEKTFLRLRAQDLAVPLGHLEVANARLAELIAKRKPLGEKLEFFKGKRLTPDLQLELDQSESAFAASADVFRGLEQDVAYIVAKYARPWPRLRRLWAGAPLGSMGLYDDTAPPAR